MKKMVRIRHSEIYCNTQLAAVLFEEAAEEASWDIIADEPTRITSGLSLLNCEKT